MCDLDFLLDDDFGGPIRVGDRVRVGRRKKSSKPPHDLVYYKEGDSGTVTEVPNRPLFDDRIIVVKMDASGETDGFFLDRLTVIKS